MVIIRTLQQTPQERLDADNLEVLSAHRVSPDRPGGAVGLQAETRYGHSGNGRKHGIAITHVAHFGIGKNRIGLVGASERHYLVWVRHINGPQDQRLQYAKDNDIGGDSERQGQHGRDGKDGRTMYLAKGKSQILHQVLHWEASSGRGGSVMISAIGKPKFGASRFMRTKRLAGAGRA